jgi:hypothetical protein
MLRTVHVILSASSARTTQQVMMLVDQEVGHGLELAVLGSARQSMLRQVWD